VVSFTPLPLYHRERDLGTHWIGVLMDPRAGLDDLEKRKFLTLPGLELRTLSRPARSRSLYRLRYPRSSLPKYENYLVFMEINLGKGNMWDIPVLIHFCYISVVTFCRFETRQETISHCYCAAQTPHIALVKNTVPCTN
jgi:hypothetical protein